MTIYFFGEQNQYWTKKLRIYPNLIIQEKSTICKRKMIFSQGKLREGSAEALYNFLQTTEQDGPGTYSPQFISMHPGGGQYQQLLGIFPDFNFTKLGSYVTFEKML